MLIEPGLDKMQHTLIGNHAFLRVLESKKKIAFGVSFRIRPLNRYHATVRIAFLRWFVFDHKRSIPQNFPCGISTTSIDPPNAIVFDNCAFYRISPPAMLDANILKFDIIAVPISNHSGFNYDSIHQIALKFDKNFLTL